MAPQSFTYDAKPAGFYPGGHDLSWKRHVTRDDDVRKTVVPRDCTEGSKPHSGCTARNGR